MHPWANMGHEIVGSEGCTSPNRHVSMQAFIQLDKAHPRYGKQSNRSCFTPYVLTLGIVSLLNFFANLMDLCF